VRLLTLDELDEMPDQEFLIDGVLPSRSLCMLYGAPGCGKTFVALSMAMSVADGRPWLKRQTLKGAVLYVAAEGVGGMKYRVRAYRCLHETDGTNMRFLPEPIQLIDRDALRDLQNYLAAENFKPCFVIVDTLARVTVGADENSSRDMGQVVEAVDRWRRDLDCTVLLIHHTRKKGDTERGSTALRGAADVMIACKKTGQVVVVECVKMKDAEPFAGIEIELEKVDLGDGHPSLVAVAARGLSQPSPVASPAAKHVETLVGVLNGKFAKNGATNADLEHAFREQTSLSESTFARALREASETGRVRKVGEGQQARYFVVGVSVK
jgi:RecA/RadA recombinase